MNVSLLILAISIKCKTVAVSKGIWDIHGIDKKVISYR